MIRCDICKQKPAYAEIYVLNGRPFYWIYACKECFHADRKKDNGNGYCLLTLVERLENLFKRRHKK